MTRCWSHFVLASESLLGYILLPRHGATVSLRLCSICRMGEHDSLANRELGRVACTGYLIGQGGVDQIFVCPGAVMKVHFSAGR